jgi:very-short-patch-repair endonuclease/predicted transcriptional regulator of viral defense system
MPKKRPGQPQNLHGVAELAARQHGVVAARQLYSLGLSDRQLRRIERAGLLHRLHQGVYALGYRPLTRRGEWMGALLAMGDGAVLSHRSAAGLWRIWGEGERRVVEVIVPRRHGRMRRAGIKVHRPTVLVPEELAEHEGLPVTSPPRTLLDLAACLPSRQLERAIDEASRLSLCEVEELAAVSRIARRPGSRQLRAVLSRHLVGSTATRSELEERFLALCQRHRLPQPEVNVPLLEYIVDFLWREPRLIVEVDGRAAHGTRLAFQTDRDRDGRLAVAGYRVVRFTWWDVVRRSVVVADRIRRLLAAHI